jgi:hypothetical protein
MSMTDASPMNDPQVVSMLDNLRSLSAQIKQIDSELGTDASGPVAQRNKIASGYVTQFESDDNFKGFMDKVIGFVNSQTNSGENKDLLVAIYTELSNRMSKDFGKSVRDHLDAQVAALPKQETSEISDARKSELAAERAKKVGIFKAQKDMLKFYDVLELPSDIEEPAVRRGAIGGRGAQFTKTYQFYYDGKLQQLTDSDGVKTDASLSNIATAKLKKSLNWSTKQLRDFIVEQLGAKVNSQTNEVDLPDVWEVNLPAPVNAVLKGVVTTNASVDESDDGEDEVATSETTEDTFAGA